MSSEDRSPGVTAGQPVRLTRHPAERGAPGRPVLLASGCCCTCCCCLHTVGGLVGAVIGATRPGYSRPRRTSDPDYPHASRWDRGEYAWFPVTTLYWLLVVVLSGVAVGGICVSSGPHVRGLLFSSLFLVVLGFPAVQLAASLVAALLVALFYKDKTSALVRIGKITLWSVLGALLGGGLMWGFLRVLR